MKGYIKFFGQLYYDKYALRSDIKAEPKKTVDELAKEVINGRWGNGEERKQRLTAADYDYGTVQKRVNELCKKTETKSVDELAKEVIKGLWGNGAERKQGLTDAGYDYKTIQNRVNELCK